MNLLPHRLHGLLSRPCTRRKSMGNPGFSFPKVKSKKIKPFFVHIHNTGFGRMKGQFQSSHNLLDLLQGRLSISSTGADNHKVSGPREFHPRALSEPDMNLSAHPAPIIQP
jgi:hypothetical protein